VAGLLTEEIVFTVASQGVSQLRNPILFFKWAIEVFVDDLLSSARR